MIDQSLVFSLNISDYMSKILEMKKILLIVILVLPSPAFILPDVIQSKMHSWQKPTRMVQPDLFSATLFEGSAYDMEYLQMTANALLPSPCKSTLQVPANEEHLLLIKTGVLSLGMRDSSWSIGGGSVALLMPGEKYTLQNTLNDSCTYYVMKYRSKAIVDMARAQASGGSFVKDWNKLEFKPHERGGIRKYFERPTAMAKRFEMHVTTLKEGIKSHEPHTHRAEEIVLIIDNKTEMQIGDKFYKGGTGDVYYLGSNVSHAIRNDGKGTCTYFAFQFE
jgi:(S)-ureidoglycine aminohydrolase